MAETKENEYQDEVRVLNGLLAVQNVIYVFHSSEKVAEFSSAAIKLISGINTCSYCLFGHSRPYGDRTETADRLAEKLSGISDFKPDESVILPASDNLKIFNLQSRRYFFGYVLITASDHEMFEKFHPAISNHLNIVAINLENQLQNDLLLENEKFLESEVEKRTKELRDEISGHEQSQIALKESKERYRELADTIPVGIFECDVKGEMIYANKTALDWFGYSEQDIAAGISIYDCLTIENHEKAQNNVRLIEERGISSDNEYKAKRRDGSVFYINISSFPIYKKGQLSGLRGTISDISERKNAEVILRKSENHFRTLFEKSHEGIMYISTDGHIIRSNDALTKILGFTTEELKSEMLSDRHLGFAGRENHKKLMSILNGEDVHFEISHPHKEGHLVILDFSASMVEIENEQVIIALIRDITSKKNIELALQQKTSDLENLVGISNALISTLEFEELLQTIVENAVKLHALESGALYLIKDQGIYLHATSPALPPGVPDEVRFARVKDHPHIRKALRTGNVVTLGDTSAEKLSPAEKEIVDLRRLVSCIYVPILIQNRPIGILILSTTEKKKIFNDDEINIYKMLSTQVGLVIENAMLFRERKKSEESLLKFRLGIERSPEAVFITDPNGIITYINPAFTKIYGYSEEEAIGFTPRILKSGSYPDEHYSDFWITLLAKHVIEGELVNKRKDGTLITIEGVNNPIVNEYGEIIGFLGIHHDISLRKTREEALKFSEERFRKAFMTNPDSVNINRLEDGLYVAVNEGFTSLTGYSQEEVIGRSSYEINIWENVDDRARLVKALKETGIVQNLEAKFRFKDGTVRTGLMSASIIVFNDEPHIISITRDIEEIKRTQDALRVSEERFKQVTENAEEWIWEIDSKGMYTYASPVVEKILGYKPEELVGKKYFYDLFAPDQKEIMRKEAFKVFKARGKFNKFINKNINKDGEIIFLETTGAPILDGPDSLLGYRGADSNVTERIINEEKLRKLSLAVEQSPASIVITNTRGDIEYVNNRFMELTGYSWKELSGNNPRVLKSGKTEPSEYKKLWDRISSGKDWKGEFLNRKKNGEHFWEAASISPIFDGNGKITHYLGIKEDITEKKEAAKFMIDKIIETEERERLRYSNELHDGLGPIISTIKLYFQLLNENEEPAQKKLIIAKAETCIDEAIQSLKEISHNLSPNIVNNFGLVAGLQSFINRLRETQVFKIDFKSGLEGRLERNVEVTLYRIVTEMINNTFKYAGASRVSIELRYSAAHSKVTLEYKDDGKGFDVEKTLLKGRGLGISNIHQRVRAMNGYTVLRSATGKGVYLMVELNSILIKA